MNQPLYQQRPPSYTKEEIKRARRLLVILGLCFVATGVWAIWAELPLGQSTRFFTAGLVASFGERVARNMLFGAPIAIGVLMVCVSFLKPYGMRTEKK
jgi:hypothetical protein